MAIEIKNISKNYGKKVALKKVDLVLEDGIYGLLGSNGAGKSTLLNILVTSLSQTSGEVLYNGTDIRDKGSDYLEKLGYLPQNPRFYKNYTAEEFLRYMAALKGVNPECLDKRIPKLLAFVNLKNEGKTKIGNFSGGMVQRIGIAQALINNPKILILDEPTAGLDPMERIRLRNLISNVAKNKIVIIATHIVPDVEYIANRIILLKNGEICRNDKPTVLTDEIYGKVWSVNVSADELSGIVTKNRISNIFCDDGIYNLRIISENQPAEGAVLVSPTLEDVFFYHSNVKRTRVREK